MSKALNLLLIEDNRADVMLVKTVLEEAGIPHQASVINTGQGALEFVKGIDPGSDVPIPDLVLLDINLPFVSGLEVLRQFRKNPTLEHVPIIVMSSSVAPKEQDCLAELRVARFFRKPNDYDEFSQLTEIIREVMGPTTAV